MLLFKENRYNQHFAQRNHLGRPHEIKLDLVNSCYGLQQIPVFSTTTKSFKNNRPPFQGRRINRLTLFLVPAPVRAPSCCVILKGVGGLFPGGGRGGGAITSTCLISLIAAFLGQICNLLRCRFMVLGSATLNFFPLWGCYAYATFWSFSLWVCYAYAMLWLPFRTGFVMLMLRCGFLFTVGLLRLCYVVASFSLGLLRLHCGLFSHRDFFSLLHLWCILALWK